MLDNISSLDVLAESYVKARDIFKNSAKRANAELHEISLSGKGPEGEDLTIDIACVGNIKSRKVLIHSSGLHGVEGYIGSAIQSYALQHLSQIQQHGLVFVHCLNPYGMAWLRRANSNNVDLNRNSLPSGERYVGSPEIYCKINTFLNSLNSKNFFVFLLFSLYFMSKYGFNSVKDSIAGGQYDFPDGIFFGGYDLQNEIKYYKDWLNRNLNHAEYVFKIDVHTGLGRFGRETLIIEDARSFSKELADILSENSRKILFQKSIFPNIKTTSYKVRGSLENAILEALPNANTKFVTQEFGTYPSLICLHALLEENRSFASKKIPINNSESQRLKNLFYPPSKTWREEAISKGFSLLNELSKFLIYNINM